MTILNLPPGKHTPLHTPLDNHHVLDQVTEILAPAVPSQVQVTVDGMPIMNRIVKNPVAIAVRYTNHNDLARKELLVSFDVHIVDNHTSEKLMFPQRHLETEHCAVCIQSLADMNSYIQFKEEFSRDCPGTVWVEE